MISARTLRKWRKKALNSPVLLGIVETKSLIYTNELREIILKLTQELLDQDLLK